jgi:hypothetical protein
MASSVGREFEPGSYGLERVGLDLNARGSVGPDGELRVEGGDDPIGTL